MHVQGDAGECMCKVAHVQGGAVHVHALSLNTFANQLREGKQNAVLHEVRLGGEKACGPPLFDPVLHISGEVPVALDGIL